MDDVLQAPVPLPDDEPTPQQKAAAYAAALRRQQPQTLQTQPGSPGPLGSLGPAQSSPAELLFSMGENPVTQPFGHQAVQAQQHAQQMQQQAADRTLWRAIQEQNALNKGNGAGRLFRTYDGSAYRVGEDGEPVQLTGPQSKQFAPHSALAGRGGQAGGAPMPADSASLDAEADYLAKTGKYLLSARGKEAMAHNALVLRRAIARHQDFDPAGASAGYHANTSSLTEAQKLADSTDANEGKALADMQVLEKTMQPLLNTRSPWVNKHGRELEENAGNPDVTAFRTARLAAVATINKVLNSGTLTESARKEADALLRGDATLAQLHAGLQVLKQDMARSKEALHRRVTDTQARISGKPTQEAIGQLQQTAAGAAPAPTPSPSPATHTSAELDAARRWLADPVNASSPWRAKVEAVLKGAGGG